MALKKIIEYKGVNAEYWKIISKTIDLFNNKTSCTLGLYMNNNARKKDIRNVLDRKDFVFDGDLNTIELYLKIKEPILELQEDDTLLDINWFSDAEDV